jgi:hypothetical protein
LNKDAVSKQNSQAALNDMVSLSQQREKIIARNFANHFVKELYLEVYRLVLLNEKQQKVVRIAGNFQAVNPQEWADEVTCTVELKLGYNEQQQEAMKFMTIHSTLAADPGNARLYTEANRYAVFKSALEKTGIKQINQYLTDPSKLPPPQPDQFKVQEMQLEERKVAVQESVAQNSAKKVDDHAQIEMLKLQLEKMQLQMEQVLKGREVDVKQFVAESNAALHTQELHLMEKEMAITPPQTQAVLRT